MDNNSVKQQLIVKYIQHVANQLNQQYNGIINEEKFNRVIDMFKDSQLPYEEVIKQINDLVEKTIHIYLEEKEKIFNPDIVKENHKQIYSKLEVLVKKLNENNIDYQLAGALCAYIKYGVESNRTHDDIDINLNEEDIDKFKKVCEEMGLQFHDNRLTTTRVLKNGIPSGEHEVLATLEGSDFHIGAFCFERKQDGTVINKGYYHDDSGQIFSRDEIIEPELAKEIFGREEVDFRGQKLTITPPEFVYRLKKYTKNDKDLVDINFMNERIDKNKLEQIESLSKTSTIVHTKVKEILQKYNYNIQLNSIYNINEVLEYYKKNGITSIGFAPNMPQPDLILPDEDHKMLNSEVEDYISSINKMKNANPDMTILSGFEAEFDPMRESFLGEMREKVDYMILGQLFVPRGLMNVTETNNPNYPIEYANMVSKAIDSGIFDIVSHPDIFMQFKDTMDSEENKKLFDENSVIASQIICEKAKDMGLPIELNLKDFEENKDYSFWKIAQEIEGLKILKNVDLLNANEQIQQDNNEVIQLLNDKIIKTDYNPVVARQNNLKLQEAFKIHQKNALTFETHMINNIVNGALEKTEDGLDSNTLADIIDTSLDNVSQSCTNFANEKGKSIIKEVSDISEDTDLSVIDKNYKIERKKQAYNETNQVLINQQKVIETAKNNVLNAMNMGCETKMEYSNMITQITQYQSTKNVSQKQLLESNINEFKQSKYSQEYVQLRKKEKKNDNNFSSGFANSIFIIIIVLFLIIVAIFIGCILHKMGIGG